MYVEGNPLTRVDPTGESIAVPAPWIWIVPVPGARVVGGVLLLGAGAYAIYEMCQDDNVSHTCTLDNEQVHGGPLAGWSTCNYTCSDGQFRSFIARSGKCPRIVSAKDRSFK